MRLIILSNRVPISLHYSHSSLAFKRSIGGLVTGIESYIARIATGETPFQDYLWIGWPGISIPEKEQAQMRRWCMDEHKFVPVYLSEDMSQKYYSGFCNRTIWPLFHNFPDHVSHDADAWTSYRRVNELFFSVLKEFLQEDDMVWIHDYHLMTLPALIRKEFPRTRISFFLHIPFPGFDVFRHLPQVERRGLLEGLAGADVIGFHTPGYVQDFLECVSRTLHVIPRQQELEWDGRRIRIDAFPMSIDYRMIKGVAQSDRCQAMKNKLLGDFAGRKLILSIDRLDYTKGILNRLIAFDQLLRDVPEWKGKILLMLLVAPSRREIPSYERIKRHIDEWVGRINGAHGTNTWVPVIYQYRQFDLTELCALYGASDVALVTPLKDGMNLIAKEYVTSHTDRLGVLILSEMAGAIHELTDALSVNPYSVEEMVAAMSKGLTMGEEEQRRRNDRMHRRLETYDVVKWAQEIMEMTLSFNQAGHLGATA
jgi:trehalose 6-phosphate synthase/phosphatase